MIITQSFILGCLSVCFAAEYYAYPRSLIDTSLGSETGLEYIPAEGEEEEIQARSIEEILDTAKFFTPTDPNLFFIWRDTVLARSHPHLYPSTDPEICDAKRIEDLIGPILVPYSMKSAVIARFHDLDERSAVTRALYALRILFDLDLIIGDSACGSRFERIAQSVSQSDFSADSIVMSFRMAVPRCPHAWNSFKRIAVEYGVDQTELAKYVGELGQAQGARWLIAFLGIRCLPRMLAV